MHSPRKGIGHRLGELERSAASQQVLPTFVRFVDMDFDGVEQSRCLLDFVKKHHFAAPPASELYGVGDCRFPDSVVVHRVAAGFGKFDGRDERCLARLPCAGHMNDPTERHGFDYMWFYPSCNHFFLHVCGAYSTKNLDQKSSRDMTKITVPL